ncbi:MAG: hypothetical protein ACFFE3_13170, partial [Candidatus Thorarchaeota archaeon]
MTSCKYAKSILTYVLVRLVQFLVLRRSNLLTFNRRNTTAQKKVEWVSLNSDVIVDLQSVSRIYDMGEI